MMKLAVLLSVLGVAFGQTMLRGTDYYKGQFQDWMKIHDVVAESEDHLMKMLQNFAKNDDLIQQHNAGNHSYTLGHNQFSHMSFEEWKEYVHLTPLAKPVAFEAPLGVHRAPADFAVTDDQIDWVSKGAVTPVKDQGQCGSCWSFSTTGALEGAYYIKYGELKSFSEQHFVDCDNPKNGGDDLGCNGGLMDNAFQWAKKNGGVCQESSYPYASGSSKKAGECKDSTCGKVKEVAPNGYTDVEVNSDAALMSALAKQPVSVAIEADQPAFQLYKSGVFTAACGTNLDHGVLAVGYGTMNGTPYYKVKNSWGPSWGDGGYIYLQRGVAQPEGQCGILSVASYPNL